MGDDPFREAQPPGGRSGRASYGGLSPLVEDMGKTPQQRNKDPYFTPPADFGRSRGTPYLDPPPSIPGSDQQPSAGGHELPPVPEPPQPTVPKWAPPRDTGKSGGNQAYGGQWQVKDDKPINPLVTTMSSKSEMMVRARDPQRGTTAFQAISAGAAGGIKGLLTPVSWIVDEQVAIEESSVGKSFSAIKETYEMDKRLLEKLTAKAPLAPEEAKHLVALKGGLKIKDDVRLTEVLLERQTHFNPTAIQSLNAAKTSEHLTTIRAMELSLDGKILTKSERGLLQTRHLALESIDKLELAAESKWFDRAINVESAKRNASRAFVLTFSTGALLSGDHSIRERMYGADAKSWETTSLTVPLAMALGRKWWGKAGLGAAAIVGGHLVDSFGGPPWVPESLKHFSVYDAVPLGLAFASRSNNNKLKAGLVTLAAASGNIFESIDDKVRKSPGDVEATAIEISLQDKSERSFSSFEKSVQAFKNLGTKNEILLEGNLGRLLVDSNQNYTTMSQEEKLAAHRKTAALAKAIGEYRLDNGTRLSATATERPTYILDGMNLDMGGDSLLLLQLARNSVRGSSAMTEILMDRQAFGTIVTKQELDDLNKVDDKVSADIEAINGKHDIVKAMDKLKTFIERGSTAKGAIFNKEMAYHKTFVTEINTKLGRNMPQLRHSNGELRPDATMMVSKLLRDQALAKMAQADCALDHGDDPIKAEQMIFGTAQGRTELLPGTNQPKGFDGALDALTLAERLAPDNPDLPELKAIANRLANRIKAKQGN